MKEIGLSTALIALGCDSGWSIVGGNVFWREDHKGHKPTTREVQEKRDQLIEEHKRTEYQRSRLVDYPSIGEQLDMLFHDIEQGATMDKEGAFYQAINKVKKKYPKSVDKIQIEKEEDE